VGKVIALGPGGKAQAPKRDERDERYRHVIDLARERGQLDEPQSTPACRNYEEADDTRRAILRSARYYCSCGRRTCAQKWKNYPTANNPEGGCPHGGQRITARADIMKAEDGTLFVQVIYHDKAESMRWTVQRYGKDPSKWPYQARAKRLKEDA